MATETKTFYPGAYEGSTFDNLNDMSNAVGKGSDNSTYAALVTGSTAEIYWTFDVSAIPSGATIDSVLCNAKARMSNVSYVTEASMQLYSGTTAKGSKTNFNSTTTKIYALSDGSWTRVELSSIRLRIFLYVNASRSARFYGADLTVTYTYQSEKFMLKLGGAWHDVARVFKKVSGIWVEQTDLANVIEDGVRYKNGGEIESTGPTLISFTVDGKTYQAEPEMTWAAFCSSAYNTQGWESDGYEIIDASGAWLAYSDSDNTVKETDVIVSGGSYYFD